MQTEGVTPLSRLDIKNPSRAQTVVDNLYRDVERRIAASPPGLCPVDMSLSFLQLCHAQTCGKCVPCRIGLGQLTKLISQVLDGTANMDTVRIIEKTARSIVDTADCAIGRDAARLVVDGLEGFRDDYEEHAQHHRCLASLQNPVPCVALCPAGVDIPGYMALVGAGRYADAVRLIRKDNPMPTACAYICEHPCEARCRRNMIDDPINIRGLKRYAVDHAGVVPNPPCAPATGKTVAIVGGGPGGYVAAIRAAQLGANVTLIEREHLGGTCLNIGCIPTKCLLHSAELVSQIKDQGAEIGVEADGVRVNFPQVIAHKNAISKQLTQGVAGLLKQNKVARVDGEASFTGPKTLSVMKSDGSVEEMTADAIIVATGSVNSQPPIPGLKENPNCIDSTGALSLEKLPKSMVVIGGGVIGIEFATFYADLGCEVTGIEGMDRRLPNMDKELGQNLALILKKQGVKVFTNAMVQRVEQAGEDIAVHFTCKEKEECVAGEAVLCAIGRRPYCDGLFADGISVEMNRRSIAVNERYETSIPRIYAIGDVSAKIQLAHVATAQGIACVDLLYGRENHTSMSVVPSCIYCRPEIAVVGMTEAEAKDAGIAVKVGKHVMFDNAKTVISDPGRCFMKFVANAETHELLGAQLMCEHSSDMIGGVSQALANRMSAESFRLAMRPHPSFEEAMTAALEDLAQKLG